ncbi:hypothetical protein FA13DRAFT_1716313 [Coprinellus micaceus]|uniref:Helicase C-terminal domain-containing protein n=1 Tax=Coprinellus micaceus TaxID=71717 RepID=A0A4Y7SKA5_COPMI|nr:hypothetical protein FA13DRAFT_1716313 [Coprinellus micaceus]
MNRPTKLDAIARLAAYLLFSGCRTMPAVADGQLVIPEYDPMAGGDNKLLIYQEFTVFMQLLIDVLRVHGVEAVFINETQAFKTRNSIIKKFKENPTTRCFVFSKVGAVGLNLTEANYMIFLDQQWSFADENQAIGRLHRQGQKRPVGVFHILAAGTVDYILYNAARGKALMSQAFLTTEKQEKMANLVSGGDPGLGSVPTDGEEDEETPRVQSSTAFAAGGSKSSKSKGKMKSTLKGRKDEGSEDDDRGPNSSDAEPKAKRSTVSAAGGSKSSKSKGRVTSTLKGRGVAGSDDDDSGADSEPEAKSKPPVAKAKQLKAGRKAEGEAIPDRKRSSSLAHAKTEDRSRSTKEEKLVPRKEKSVSKKEKSISNKEQSKPSKAKMKKSKAEAEEEEESEGEGSEGENMPEEARERQRTTAAKSGKGTSGKATRRGVDVDDSSEDRPAQKKSMVKGKGDAAQEKGDVERPGHNYKLKETKAALKKTKGKGVLRVEAVEIPAQKKPALSAEGGGKVNERKEDGRGKANEGSGVVKSGKKSALKNAAAAKQGQASGSSKVSLKEKTKRKPPPKSSEIVEETDSELDEYPIDELYSSEPEVPSTKAPTTAPVSDRDDMGFDSDDMRMGIDLDVEMGRYSRPGSSASMHPFSGMVATSSLKGSIALQQKKRERAESIQHAGDSSGKRQREYTSPQQTVVKAPHAGVPPLPLRFTQSTQPIGNTSSTLGALDPPFGLGTTGRRFAQKRSAGSGEGSRASSQSGSRSRPHSARPRSPSSQGSRFGLVKGGRQPLGPAGTFTPEEDVEMGDDVPLEIDHAQAPFTQYRAGEDPRGRRTNTDIRAKIDAGLLERRMDSRKKYEPQHVIGEPSASSSSRSQMGHVFRRGAAAFAPPPGGNTVPTMTQPFSSAAIAVKKDKGKKKEKKKGKKNEREKESE